MKALCATLALSAGLELEASESQQLGIDPERITVSGMSSGAQMAHQLHIAYSELFSGAALIAGGPYGCAEGSVRHALGRCLGKPGTEIPMENLLQNIQAAAANGQIAALENLANDPVWIFHGSLDTAVPETINSALVSLYEQLVDPEKIENVVDVPAAHTFPTNGAGGACDVLESPFVGNCGYDAAGELLNHLYRGLVPPANPVATSLTKVALDGAEAASLDPVAWLFVPPACEKADASCALHLVLHGCAQSASQVGMAFMEQSGFLAWAESNDIVLAFPQVVISMPNALACWDWWGYSDENYLWRNGHQPQVLANWVRKLAGISSR